MVTGRQEVKGLTTAAGLWTSGCMGLALGAGFYECTLLGFLMIFLSVHLFPKIENAVMVLHGDAAHSCYMGRDALALLKGENKELVHVPGAVHTDLYDGGGKDAVPWDTIQSFFERYLA